MGQHQAKEFEYNYIADGISIGTNQCCTMHFDERLLQEGVTADMSLEEERLDAPFGVDFYVWIPVKNQAAPDPQKLEFGVAVLEKWVAMGRKMYVHCANGHGRAPTVVAAYLIKAKGYTPEEAEAFVKEKRPSIHLEDVQREALLRFAQTLSPKP
jgi:protein-tyrosine phosphatase